MPALTARDTVFDTAALDRCRARRGIRSRRALALRAGVDPTNLSRICRGLTSPSLDTVAKLAAALGVGARQLVHDRSDF